MYNFFSKRLNGNRKGFTLVELLVVIAIIAILIAIAVMNMGGANKTAKVNTHNANIREILAAAALYVAENPTNSAIAPTDLKGNHKLAKYFKQGMPMPMYKNGIDQPPTANQAFNVEVKSDGSVIIKPGLAAVQADGKVKVEESVGQ